MTFDTRTFRFAAITFGALIAALTAGSVIGGIQGSGFARMASIGTLDTRVGFTVNGISYDVTHARVTVDGVVGDASMLKEGHVVTVKSTVSGERAVPIAQEISLVNDVRGVVTEVDAAAGSVTVLGQTIRVADGAMLASLTPGTEVAASGFANGEGELVASRVDAVPSGAISQLRGVVADLDTTTESFEINGLAVEYSSAQVAGPLETGAVVTVQGSAAAGGFTLLATRVDRVTSPGAPGERGDVSGLVTRFVSERDFDVNGLRVLAGEATKYPVEGTLGLDAAVRVKGRFDVTGALVADQIRMTPPAAEAARQAQKAQQHGQAEKRPNSSVTNQITGHNER